MIEVYFDVDKNSMKIKLNPFGKLLFFFFLTLFTFPLFATVQAQEWQEVVNSRTRTSKTFSSDNGQYRHEQVLKTVLHYPTAGPDSSVLDGEVDFTPQRVNNAQLDGWLITHNGWHYALGKPGDKTTDGWVGFGGRQGQNWVKFRLARTGYLHWPTRNWQDLGGAPTYNRANLTNNTQTLTLGPAGSQETLNVSSQATWSNLWTTPGGGALSISWRVEGRELKEEITINQEARSWITANRPPSTPLSETYFGFVFQLDWSDIPKVIRAGIEQNRESDFADDNEKIELKDNLDRLLAFMPVSDAYVVDDNGKEIEDSRTPLRKRFYKEGANTYLLVGLRTDTLTGLPDGDLVIDPTLTLQPNATDGVDTYNYGSGVTTNFGTSTVIDTKYNRNIFLLFSLASIPVGATSTSATLTLQCVSGEAGATTVSAYDITQTAWTESGLTWNTYDGSNNWGTAGGDFGSTVRGSFSLPDNTLATYNVSLTASWVQSFFAGNIHIALRTPDGRKDFASSDHTTEAYRPKLVVEYTANTDPSSPTSATQLKNDASTAISNGGYTNETNVKLKASATDADTSEILNLFFEAVANASSFTSTATPTTGGSCVSGTAFADCASKIWYVTSDSGDYSSTAYTGTVNVTGLSDATGYKWQVKACDDEPTCSAWVAFNASTPNFTIDTTAPSVPGTPSTTSPTNDTTPSWSWTASTDTGSGLAATPYTVQWCQDSGFTGCAANTSTSTTNSFTHSTALADGIWYFKVKAKDTLSNESSYSSNGSADINTTAPTGSVSINSGAGYTGTRAVTLTISATDDVDSASSLTMKVSNSSDLSDASYEAYATSKSWTLTTTDGTKTVYIKFKDSVGNESGIHSDTIVFDATAPNSFSLEDPNNSTYTNNERPTFKWKAASTPDATSGLAKYKLEIDNGDTGDFTIDGIDPSRTTDYSTNKYTIKYENFSDSDSTNNYISVTTKSSSEWGTSENEGKVKEGKRTWKVTAYDNADNSKEESTTFYADFTGPSVSVSVESWGARNGYKLITNSKPTISGTVTDTYLPETEKIELSFYKETVFLGIVVSRSLYSLENHTLQNTKKESSLSFSLSPSQSLESGNYYELVVSGIDKAGNKGQTTLSIRLVSQESITASKEEISKEEEKPKLSLIDLEKNAKKARLKQAGELAFPRVSDFLILAFKQLGFQAKILATTIFKNLREAEAFFVKTGNQAVFLTQTVLQNNYQKGAKQISQNSENLVKGTKQGVGQSIEKGKLAEATLKDSQKKVKREFLSLKEKKLRELEKSGKAWNEGIATAEQSLSSTLTQTAKDLNSLKAEISQNTIALAKTSQDQVAKPALKTINSVNNNFNSLVGQARNKAREGSYETSRQTQQRITEALTAFNKSFDTAGHLIASGFRQKTFVLKEQTDKVAQAIQRVGDGADSFYAFVFDPNPTKIADVTVEETGRDYLVVSWTTNHPTFNNKVNFGTDLKYGGEARAPEGGKYHQARITNLKPGMKYFFEVMSQGKNYVYDAYYSVETKE